ncbi:MAG TPA: hypothetical protein VNO34_08835 [Actinomycetota bacterium]|nr:hypothetical protein [Actinomycetota bacterium]
MRAWGVLVVLVAATVSCARQAGPAAGGPSVSIRAPAQGATVTSPVQLTLEVQSVKVGAPETGSMHFHVHVDDAQDYAVLYETTGSVEVPPGRHTIRVVLARPNHEETETSASVSVTVSQGGPGIPTPRGGYHP